MFGLFKSKITRICEEIQKCRDIDVKLNSLGEVAIVQRRANYDNYLALVELSCNYHKPLAETLPVPKKYPYQRFSGVPEKNIIVSHETFIRMKTIEDFNIQIWWNDTLKYPSVRMPESFLIYKELNKKARGLIYWTLERDLESRVSLLQPSILEQYKVISEGLDIFKCMNVYISLRMLELNIQNSGILEDFNMSKKSVIYLRGSSDICRVLVKVQHPNFVIAVLD